MHLTGTLDTRLLAELPDDTASPERCGMPLEHTARTRVIPGAEGCTINIGALDHAAEVPLAQLIRERGRFVLRVPRHSFLSLYYGQHKGVIRWSTQLAAVADAVGSRAANTEFERFGLKYQIWPGAETVFAGIRKLGPGQQLLVDGDTSTVEPAPQGPIDSPQVDPEDSAAVQTLIYETLLAALEQLSPPQGTTGVMLGGFDSALIVALLAELGRPVHAVTLGYENSKYNQAHITDLQKRYGFRHDWVRIEPALIREGLLQYGELFDQPVTQPHYLISGLHLARLLADSGVSTALTGDGCDGVFFGYPTVFKKARLVRLLQRFPAGLKQLLHAILNAQGVERLAGQPARLARQLLEVTARPEHLQNFLTALAVDDNSAKRALGGAAPSEDFEREQLEALYQGTVAGKDWVDITYISKNMVGLNRAKLAGIWNHSGLERIYSPYMMPAVTAMAAAIPKEYWLSDETPSGKYLLTQMSLQRGLLSEDIVYQKKMSPVASPVDAWLRGELRSDVLRLLAESTLDAGYCRELLRRRLLEEWYKRQVTIDDYASQALGMLLSYARMVEMKPPRA